jgi:hypothetical protein
LTGAGPETAQIIAPDDRLYRRLARDVVKDGIVNRGAYYFRGQPDPSISVDLGRLTTPEETRQRARNPAVAGVGELLASVPLALGFNIRHAPVEGNPAHCLIEGRTTKDLCQLLADRTRIIIAPPEDR